jgi:hypothetical protein
MSFLLSIRHSAPRKTRTQICANLPDDEYGRIHEKGWGSFVGIIADLFGRGHCAIGKSASHGPAARNVGVSL